MHVITLASRRDGAGKSTLSTQLAAAAQRAGRRSLIIDTDPHGSLTERRCFRLPDEPLVRPAANGIEPALAAAKADGYAWAFVDTPAYDWVRTSAAIGTATLVVIPVRPNQFDQSAVSDVVFAARDLHKPFAVVINAAPAKRGDHDSPVVSAARTELAKLHIPVWPGQITQRVGLAIPPIARRDPALPALAADAACEVDSLWSAILRSIAALHLTRKQAQRAAPRSSGVPTAAKRLAGKKAA